MSNPATNASPPRAIDTIHRHSSKMVNLSSITDHHTFCTFSHQQHGDLILFARAHISRSFCVFPLISRHSSSESLTTSASCSACRKHKRSECSSCHRSSRILGSKLTKPPACRIAVIAVNALEREGSADNAIEQRCNHSPCRQQGKSVVSKKIGTGADHKRK